MRYSTKTNWVDLYKIYKYSKRFRIMGKAHEGNAAIVTVGSGNYTLEYELEKVAEYTLGS